MNWPRLIIIFMMASLVGAIVCQAFGLQPTITPTFGAIVGAASLLSPRTLLRILAMIALSPIAAVAIPVVVLFGAVLVLIVFSSLAVYTILSLAEFAIDGHWRNPIDRLNQI